MSKDMEITVFVFISIRNDVVEGRGGGWEELSKDKFKWNLMYVLKRRRGGKLEWDQIIEEHLEINQNPSF